MQELPQENPGRLYPIPKGSIVAGDWFRTPGSRTASAPAPPETLGLAATDKVRLIALLPAIGACGRQQQPQQDDPVHQGYNHTDNSWKTGVYPSTGNCSDHPFAVTQRPRSQTNRDLNGLPVAFSRLTRPRAGLPVTVYE